VVCPKTLLICSTLLTAIYTGGESVAAPGRPQRPATYRVAIEDMQFRPAQLTVRPGDWIVFSNRDLFPHTVTAEGKSFDSQAIGANATWSYRAAEPGVYSYRCTFHPAMKGKITVQ
jgi:plastocyanin